MTADVIGCRRQLLQTTANGSPAGHASRHPWPTGRRVERFSGKAAAINRPAGRRRGSTGRRLPQTCPGGSREQFAGGPVPEVDLVLRREHLREAVIVVGPRRIVLEFRAQMVCTTHKQKAGSLFGSGL